MALSSGLQLGPYKILSPLGKGGMGEVYRGTDTRLEREVAIKVLPEHLAQDSQALKRFEREAKALASLSHPGILTIHDVGTVKEISFVVMELLEGETLRERMQRTKLTWDKALQIAVPVAEGLAAAHSKGVIHRDLKPENIFITEDERTKILDFGLARLTENVAPAGESSVETVSELRTEKGVVMGTVPYMSPEHVRAENVDARSDIFSFGCILYELLAENRPFHRTTSADTLAAILKDDPPEMSANKNVPEGLQQIVHRCLEKKPERRFQSASDLAFALRSVPAGVNDSKRSISTGVAVESPQTSKARIWFAIAALLLIAAGIAYLSTRPDETIDSLAVLPFVNTTGDPETEYLSDGITESLINNLSQIPELRVMARSTVFAYKGKEVDPRQVGRELNVRAVLMGKLHQRNNTLVIQSDLVDTASGSQVWGEQYNRKVTDIFSVQEDISKEIAGELRLKLTGEQVELLAKRYTQDTEAYRNYLKGLYYFNKYGEEYQKKAIGFYEQAIDIDPTYSLAYAGLAACYAMLGNIFWPPKNAFPKSIAAANRALEIDPDLAEGHLSRGAILLLYDWNWVDSEKELRRAIELNPRYAEARHLYSFYLQVAGRSDDALQEMKSAVEMDPLNAWANTDLAWTHFVARKYDRAIDLYRSTIELVPEFPMSYAGLAITFARKEMHPEALVEARKSTETFFGPQISALAGWAFAVSGEEGEARRILDNLMEMSKASYVSPIFISLIYTGLGEKDSALEWLEKAYQDRSGHMIWLNVNPLVDSLRPDPRFEDLVHRMNFPN